MVVNMIIVALIIAFLFFCYQYGKKRMGMSERIVKAKKKWGESHEERISGVIAFKDLVGYFKGLDLKKGRDIPFVADANSSDFRSMLQRAYVSPVVLFLGTYNEETDEVENVKVLLADAMDERCSEILKNEHMVVLT